MRKVHLSDIVFKKAPHDQEISHEAKERDGELFFMRISLENLASLSSCKQIRLLPANIKPEIILSIYLGALKFQ